MKVAEQRFSSEQPCGYVCIKKRRKSLVSPADSANCDGWQRSTNQALSIELQMEFLPNVNTVKISCIKDQPEALHELNNLQRSNGIKQ
jgi:hypothetical protein